MIDYYHDIHATSASVVMSCQAMHCSSQGSQLGKTENYFSPVVARMARRIYQHMEASQ